MEELSYTSKYDGETTDKILDNAKAIMEQTTAEDGETVQVYDTDGVPHKISKTELLKKSTLALPALEDISSFVAVNAAGNAVGVMTKEQVASVLAELIVTKGVLNSENDMNGLNPGFYAYYIEAGLPKNMPEGQIQRGFITVLPKSNGSATQIVFEWGWSIVYCRILNGDTNWSGWIKLSN